MTKWAISSIAVILRTKYNLELELSILDSSLGHLENRITSQSLLSLGVLKISISTVAVVQSLCCVQLFATPWTAARQASLSFPISPSLRKLTSTDSVSRAFLNSFETHFLSSCYVTWVVPGLEIQQWQDPGFPLPCLYSSGEHGYNKQVYKSTHRPFQRTINGGKKRSQALTWMVKESFSVERSSEQSPEG